jgi:Short C-terminal domain
MGLLRMATRTAVVAGTATAVSGRVARRQARKYDEQQPAYAEAPAPQAAPQAPPAAPAAPVDADMAKLQELAQMHGQGLLSDEEFSAAKAKVLGI